MRTPRQFVKLFVELLFFKMLFDGLQKDLFPLALILRFQSRENIS